MALALFFMKRLNNGIFIYFIENRINGKIYVGKAVKPTKRWTTHKTIARGGKEKYTNKYYAIHAAISKYGVSNFIFSVSEYYSTDDEVNEAEKYWISYLKQSGVSLYNETEGGDGMSFGMKLTEEQRNKISKSKLGKKATDEAKKNMSAARKFEFAGEKNNKAKLTEEKVKELRNLYSSGGYTHRSIAKLFNITVGTATKIINLQLWSHIK